MDSIMKKIDLKDVTFIIPVRLTDNDRVLNLITNLRYLNKYFDTNIIVKEYDSEAKADKIILNFTDVLYIFERCEKDAPFHRTRFLNDMLEQVKTPITVNHDLDIIVDPDTAFAAKKMILHEKYDVVYPYKKGITTWNNVYKNAEAYVNFIKDVNIEELTNKCYNKTIKTVNQFYLVGGSIFFNTNSYKNNGGENEEFVDWGPEDRERFFRFYILDYKIGWIEHGKIYHLEHKKSNIAWNYGIHPLTLKNNYIYNEMIKWDKEKLKFFIEQKFKKFK
jgi:hypothetical protein